MALPLRAEAPTEALAELVGRIITIVRTPLPCTARLHRGGDLERPVLLLDPDADPEDQAIAMIEALALETIGPKAAASARKVPHLRIVS